MNLSGCGGKKEKEVSVKGLDLEGEMAYASSKSAIEKMSRIMSKELSSYNITVNTIGPTPVYTDLIKVVPKDKVEEIINEQSLKRFGLFEDISNVIDFFISEKILNFDISFFCIFWDDSIFFI